jgi:hypothetical protein
MRTPNCNCVLCDKPLYRRPHEFGNCRYFACMKCRAEAQSVFGVTEAQRKGLSLGTQKGTNFRTGYSHSEESKQKIGESNKRFWKNNPEKAKERGAHLRAEKNVNWRGGITDLNKSIRQMTENRKWMDAVKERDNHMCTRCDSDTNLESHHKQPLSSLIEKVYYTE